MFIAQNCDSRTRHGAESTLVSRTLLDNIHNLQQLFEPSQAIDIGIFGINLRQVRKAA